MALSNFSGDMNVISALHDDPNEADGLTASQLKTKFDQAGNTIKSWINSVLIPFINGLASGANISSGAIGTSKIADDAIIKAKIKNGAVTTAKIYDGDVTYAKLHKVTGEEAVRTDTIKDEAVTPEKIASGAVTEGKIASGAVTNAKLASGAVTADKLAPLAKIRVTGTVYGSSLPASGETGQVFFLKV